MKHSLTRLFTPVALIVGIAFSTAAMAGNYSKKNERAADIVDVAGSAGQFTTLAAALEAAGLLIPN